MIVYLIFFLIKAAAFADYFETDVELTTIVKPQSRDCFYHYARAKKVFRFEFQVIDAGITSKDLTISVFVKTPSLNTVIKAIKMSKKITRFRVSETGDHEICFDNTYSILSSKTVYFEITLLDISRDKMNVKVVDEIMELDKNDTFGKLKRTEKILKKNLEEMKHFQDTLRTVEARDINIQEKNLVKVNTFSSLTVVCMMLFGSLHLFVLKSMFNPQSLIYKVFKILC